MKQENDMDTHVSTYKKVIKELNNLIELDFDAIAAYESAIERLENGAYKTKLGNL